MCVYVCVCMYIYFIFPVITVFPLIILYYTVCAHTRTHDKYIVFSAASFPYLGSVKSMESILRLSWQTLARHVMNVHLSAHTQTEGVEGEIPLAVFKKYIAYARRLVG